MRKILISILLVCLLGVSWAQQKNTSATKLEKQRIALLNEITETEKRLDQLNKSKNTSLESLKMLQRKLSARTQLLNNLGNQVISLDNSIGKTNNQIVVLRDDLKDLKRHYAELVRFSYKNRTAENFLLFLFSAKSFNDANRRLSYVKQYRTYRTKQAQKIELANLKLRKTADFLISSKKDKANNLQAQKQQTAALQQETSQQNVMVEKFKGQEVFLKKQLALKKQTAAQLNNAIAAAIQKEVERAKARAIEEQLAKQRAAIAQKQKEAELALAQKRKAEETKREEERRLKAEAEAARIAAENKRLEAEKAKAALEAKIAAEENRKRLEEERRLAIEKKQAEEEARKLAELKKEREEEERKAKQLAIAQRKQREAELELQRKAEESRARKLKEEERRQELQRIRLAEEKRKQRDRERELAKESKRREKEEERLAIEKAKNAKQGGQFLNPRYVPTAAEREEEERKKLAAIEEAKERVKNDYTVALTAEERNLSSSFAANKGRLPWPVSNGYISDHFGKNKHPVFDIYTENYGMDIKTQKGSPAYAVFAGEVSSVIYLPGAGQTVLVNHGSFYTVYSKLMNVSVQKGQKIKLKQVMGTVMSDDSGNSKIHFEIWSVGADGSSKKENPEYWVKKG